MFRIILAIPFYAALFIAFCVIVFYLIHFFSSQIAKRKKEKHETRKLNQMLKEYDKIEVDLTHAKLKQMNLQTREEPYPTGMIKGIGMALGDKDNSETSITKSVSKFNLKIKHKGQTLSYESPYLKTDEITLLFLLNEQKTTIAYISPYFPKVIDLDLSFLPKHFFR